MRSAVATKQRRLKQQLQAGVAERLRIRTNFQLFVMFRWDYFLGRWIFANLRCRSHEIVKYSGGCQMFRRFPTFWEIFAKHWPVNLGENNDGNKPAKRRALERYTHAGHVLSYGEFNCTKRNSAGNV